MTIKQLPADVHRRLAERARRNHRSLNGEILATLARAVDPDADVAGVVARSNELVERMHFVAGADDIAAFRVTGRH